MKKLNDSVLCRVTTILFVVVMVSVGTVAIEGFVSRGLNYLLPNNLITAVNTIQNRATSLHGYHDNQYIM